MNSQSNLNPVELRRISEPEKIEEVPIRAFVLSYAPNVFRFIRAIDGVDEYAVMTSVSTKQNKTQLLKTSKKVKHSSGGRSKSFFFFT